MGREAQYQAKKLGMMNKPQYTFYAQPRKYKVKASKIKPDIAYLLEGWFKNIDPDNVISESSSGGRTSRYFYLAPQANVYVEIINKISGFSGWPEANHVNKIDIYTENLDFVKSIVKEINGIWEDGIVNHLKMEKLEKKFKVRREDIINAWNSFL